MFRNDSTLFEPMSAQMQGLFCSSPDPSTYTRRVRSFRRLLCPAHIDFYAVAVLDEMEELHVIESILMIFRIGFHGVEMNGSPVLTDEDVVDAHASDGIKAVF